VIGWFCERLVTDDRRVPKRNRYAIPLRSPLGQSDVIAGYAWVEESGDFSQPTVRNRSLTEPDDLPGVVESILQRGAPTDGPNLPNAASASHGQGFPGAHSEDFADLPSSSGSSAVTTIARSSTLRWSCMVLFGGLA
jgi:hypothetical protein